MKNFEDTARGIESAGGMVAMPKFAHICWQGYFIVQSLRDVPTRPKLLNPDLWATLGFATLCRAIEEA